MVEPTEPPAALVWHVRREAGRLRYFVDVPGVLDPDLDVAIEGAQLIVRAQRTLPELQLLLCRLPLPAQCDVDRLDVHLEWGVLEIELPAAPSDEDRT